MEMLMNALLLLLGIVKGCVTRLTLQEWGYLLAWPSPCCAAV